MAVKKQEGRKERRAVYEGGYYAIHHMTALHRDWTHKQIGDATGYSDSTVDKVLAVSSFAEYKERYKQPSGSEYRKLREEKAEQIGIQLPEMEQTDKMAEVVELLKEIRDILKGAEHGKA